ncbi:MAG: phosphatase PAP2 family protein [Steroidobacteraceae bacterium]
MKLHTKMKRWLALRVAGVEFAALLAVVPLGAGVLLFAELAEETIEGEEMGFDRAILLAMRSTNDVHDPRGPDWLTRAAIDFTSLGGHAVLATLVVLVALFLLLTGKRAASLLLLGSSVGAALLSAATKSIIARPRPDVIAHLVETSTASFPSGHALLSASIYLTLGVMLASVHSQRTLKLYFMITAVLLTLLIGMSRIFLGVHWPSDVLAGWCLGTAWASGCWLLATWLRSRGMLAPR